MVPYGSCVFCGSPEASLYNILSPVHGVYRRRTASRYEHDYTVEEINDKGNWIHACPEHTFVISSSSDIPYETLYDIGNYSSAFCGGITKCGIRCGNKSKDSYLCNLHEEYLWYPLDRQIAAWRRDHRSD